jgi:hypothetical protein
LTLPAWCVQIEVNFLDYVVAPLWQRLVEVAPELELAYRRLQDNRWGCGWVGGRRAGCCIGWCCNAVPCLMLLKAERWRSHALHVTVCVCMCVCDFDHSSVATPPCTTIALSFVSLPKRAHRLPLLSMGRAATDIKCTNAGFMCCCCTQARVSADCVISGPDLVAEQQPCPAHTAHACAVA